MVRLKPLKDTYPSYEKNLLNPDRVQASNKPSLLTYRTGKGRVIVNPELTIDDRFATRMAFDHVTTTRIGLDDLLKANEQAATNAFKKTIRSIPAPALSVQFSRKLRESIIPQLVQIGMNARLTLNFFRLAGPAWQSMSPYLDKNTIFHPTVYQDIKSIREGIRRQAEDDPEEGIQAQTPSSMKQMQNINSTMAPENLQGLLGQVETSWVILPRAHTHLRKIHNYYLPIYLQFIDKNDHVACNRVFTRIVIEMVANFSVKFADPRYSPIILKNVFFHAYEAMFWRTLRRPPSGFEECRIFETVLNFLDRHVRNGHPMSAPMAKALLRMQAAKSHIFPQFLHTDHQVDPARFLITLRHGAPEIGALMKYFKHKLKMSRHAQGHHSHQMALQKATSQLIRQVVRKYRQENQSTRHNVRQFFYSLRRVVAENLENQKGLAVNRLDPERFCAVRNLRMIDGLLSQIS